MTSFVIISGVSGSGKSTAIKVFEDMEYYCVDNLPANLIPTFSELCANSQRGLDKVAFVIDVRAGIFLDLVPSAIDELNKRGYPVHIIFFDSDDEVIVRRYQETRRKHPLAADGNLLSALERERKMLEPIKRLSDTVIDTSSYNVHRLKEVLRNAYGSASQIKMSVNILSFGFKNGHPSDADLVFDVRFLPNPYYDDHLKPMTGLDGEVKDFIMDNEVTGIFIEKLVDILKFLIPLYEKEGKAYLTIAFGCTGGVHRSIAIAETIGERFSHLNPQIVHRDIRRS